MLGYDFKYNESSHNNDQDKVAWFMQLHSQARIDRVNFEVQWEESASLCWPEYRNSFTFGHNRAPGQKYAQYQVDTAGSIASHRFMAIADALVTPSHLMWSLVRANNKELMKDRQARLYFQAVTECLWAHRYRAEANFVTEQLKNWQALGVFGNQTMFIDECDSKPGTGYAPGFRYVAQSPGEIYPLRNYQGKVDGCIRYFRWTARQAAQKWPDRIPPALQAALNQNSTTKFDFLHFILPRADHNPDFILAPQGMPYYSCYLSIAGYAILEEGGYRSYPAPAGGYMFAPEEGYGRGPAQMVLPELKTLNAEKSVFLKQGHRAGDPAYLIADDGLTDLKTHPGAFNFGGINPQTGKPLVQILPTGEIQITEDLMARSSKAVDDAFLVSLFPLLFAEAGKARSAREVIEAANEKGIFLAPTLGPQIPQYIGPMCDRELDLLSYLSSGMNDRERAAKGMMPRMPPILREAEGEYQLVYANPLARAMSGQAVAGFMRTVEMTGALIQQGAPPSLLYRFDFDEALPEIADMQFVPANWMASDEKVAQATKAAAASAERERQVKELPGKAAIIKAQAIQAKAQAGQNIGGTLSGVPEGQMPEMPQ